MPDAAACANVRDAQAATFAKSWTSNQVTDTTGPEPPFTASSDAAARPAEPDIKSNGD